MKKLLLAVTAASIMSSPAFAAPSATDSFVVNGTVPDTCTMQDVNNVNLGSLSISTTAGSGALLLSGDASGNTNTFWVSCNKTNTMSITGPAELQGSRAKTIFDDASFTDKLKYSVTANNYVTGGGAQPTLIAGASTSQTRAPLHHTVSLTAAVTQALNPGVRPLAGNYTATVTVTVTAS